MDFNDKNIHRIKWNCAREKDVHIHDGLLNDLPGCFSMSFVVVLLYFFQVCTRLYVSLHSSIKSQEQLVCVCAALL